MFKYSYNALVYYGEDVKASIERVARFGYDAIELVPEPGKFDYKEIRKMCEDKGLKVSSLCPIYVGDEKDLINPDAVNRRKAIDFAKSVAEVAAELGAPVMILAPNPCNKTVALAEREREMEWAVESVRACADYAVPMGVSMAMEAWNRYESYFINTLAQAKELWELVDRENVGIMGDTFHMNIDEADMASAIRDAGKALKHMHLADSNRAAPGYGHLDLLPILKALKEIGYDGYLSYELLPGAADPFAVLESGGADEFFDLYTEMAIKNTKKLEAML